MTSKDELGGDKYVESLRVRAEDARSSADHRLLVNADLERKLGTATRLLYRARQFVNEHAVNASEEEIGLARDMDDALKTGKSCTLCGKTGSPSMVPEGWYRYSLQGDRESMWPFRCASCGHFK